MEPGPLPTHPPPSNVGTFLGRGLASSARSGLWGGGQRPGWGLSMGLCASSQEASVAELTALTLQPTGPRPPSPWQPCPAQPRGPERPHGHPPLRAPRPHLLSRGCHPHSPGACSVSHRVWGSPGAELGCAPGGLRGRVKGQGDGPSSAARLRVICHFPAPPSASGAPQLRFLPPGILFSQPPPGPCSLPLSMPLGGEALLASLGEEQPYPTPVRPLHPPSFFSSSHSPDIPHPCVLFPFFSPSKVISVGTEIVTYEVHCYIPYP